MARKKIFLHLFFFSKKYNRTPSVSVFHRTYRLVNRSQNKAHQHRHGLSFHFSNNRQLWFGEINPQFSELDVKSFCLSDA